MSDSRGFSLVEIMMAIALMTTAFAAAALTERGIAYWTMSARATDESLSAVAAAIDATTGAAEDDFFHLAAAFTPDDPGCSPADECDGITRDVSDISPCAKSVDLRAARHFSGYPTKETSVSFLLSNPTEHVALGGDCFFSAPHGNWSEPALAALADVGSGLPTGIDVFEGVTYLTANAPPYLRIVTAQGLVTFSNGFVGAGPFNDIDVVRDAATGRLLAIVGAVSPQLQVIDVTDPQEPLLMGSAVLAGVTLTGAQAQAWRVFAYEEVAYVATRYMISANPEWHAFDLNDPAHPHELGTGYKTSTSIYDIVVHEQQVAGAKRRLAYLATTSPAAELTVLDVTNPASVIRLASCDLPGNYPGNALAFLGTALYVGRDTVPYGGKNIYAFAAADPLSPSFCSPLATTAIATDAYSRHTEALRASGPYLFVASTNTTNAHGQVQIRNADPATGLSLLGTFALPGLAENALDFENNTLYAAGTASPQVQALTAP